MTKEEFKRYTGCDSWLEYWEEYKRSGQKAAFGYIEIKAPDGRLFFISEETIKAAAFDEVYPKLPTKEQADTLEYALVYADEMSNEMLGFLNHLPTRKP